MSAASSQTPLSDRAKLAVLPGLLAPIAIASNLQFRLTYINVPIRLELTRFYRAACNADAVL